MHELAEGVTSINPYYGATLNPYNNMRHVGGMLFEGPANKVLLSCMLVSVVYACSIRACKYYIYIHIYF